MINIYIVAKCKAFFLPSSPYVWPLGALERLAPFAGQIGASIKSELENDGKEKTANVPRNWNVMNVPKERAEEFLMYMDCKSIAPANALADVVSFKKDYRCERLLDVAGGSGRYSVAISRQGVECTVLELPSIVDSAIEYLMDTEVKALSGDILTSIPTGYDAHLFCDTIHMFNRTDAVNILKNSFNSLPNGGHIFLSNALVNDHKTGPRNAIYFYVFMFLMNAGYSYSGEEFREMLEEAGFSEVCFFPYYGHYILISAQKRQISVK